MNAKQAARNMKLPSPVLALIADEASATSAAERGLSQWQLPDCACVAPQKTNTPSFWLQHDTCRLRVADLAGCN